MLNVTPIDYELDHIERHKDRAKMEQIDQDTTFVIQKSRIKSDREKRDAWLQRKNMKPPSVQHWNVVVKNNQRKMNLTFG